MGPIDWVKAVEGRLEAVKVKERGEAAKNRVGRMGRGSGEGKTPGEQKVGR